MSDLTERVAKAIYAKIDATGSDPWHAVMERRARYGTDGCGPEVTRAVEYANAAIAIAAPMIRSAAIDECLLALTSHTVHESELPTIGNAVRRIRMLAENESATSYPRAGDTPSAPNKK